MVSNQHLKTFFSFVLSSVCQFLFILHLQRLRQNSINSVRLPCLFGSRTELIVYGESIDIFFLPYKNYCTAEFRQ